MSDYIERMKTEYRELDTKLKALQAFIETDKFDALDKRNRQLLIEQAAHMQSYLNVLNTRLWLAHGNKE